MARDYAKRSGPHNGRRAPPARRKAAPAKASGGQAKWFGTGVLTGVFLSFLVYLGTLPKTEPGSSTDASAAKTAEPAPQPRFDFYTMLPEQGMAEDYERPAARAEDRRPATTQEASTYYLLQAGSFRQAEDAERRRAELILLGLEPSIQENSSDNGRWFRVYLGPFDSHAKMSKARGLTAGQGIDTLLLKRPAQG